MQRNTFRGRPELLLGFRREQENEKVLQELELCQQTVHKWGKANQVEFDPTKESLHVLHRWDPSGDSFKVLGVL